MDVTGKITEIRPSKSLYELGDTISLNIKASIVYLVPEHDLSGWWNTYYEVRSATTGRMLASKVINHTIAAWTTEERETDVLSLNCGTLLTSDTLSVKVEYNSWGLPFGQVKLLDEKRVAVWVRQPTVYIPPPSPTPILPNPEPYIPEPTPIIPVPTISAPGTPDTPVSPLDSLKSPWVIGSLAAIVAILLWPGKKA